MTGGANVAEDSGTGKAPRHRRGRAVVDTVRMRALPGTQNRLAALILAGKVFYRPTTATWFLQPDHGADPTAHARHGDGRALRTMRTSGLIMIETASAADDRGAYPVCMTDAGTERYRSR